MLLALSAAFNVNKTAGLWIVFQRSVSRRDAVSNNWLALGSNLYPQFRCKGKGHRKKLLTNIQEIRHRQ
jgi:hypothetical protein